VKKANDGAISIEEAKEASEKINPNNKDTVRLRLPYMED